MTVVLLTITVLGWTGSMSRCSLTKTNVRGATVVSRASKMPLAPILAEGGKGAQPTYPAPWRHETQAGAHCVCGTQIQPNPTLQSQRPSWYVAQPHGSLLAQYQPASVRCQ